MGSETFCCDVTRRTKISLEKDWLEELSRMNEQLDHAPTWDAYKQALQSFIVDGGLSFELRRYVYEAFTKRNRTDETIPYTVRFQGKTYEFSRLSLDIPEAEEVDTYGELLYRITLANGCCKENNPKSAMITKDTYKTYLSNAGTIDATKSNSRRKMFTLSFALGMDESHLEKLAKVLGEIPYNFHDPIECIYYFCHNSTSFRFLPAVRQLIAEYDNMKKAVVYAEDSSEALPATEVFREELDDIIGGEFESEEAQKEAVLQYLVYSKDFLSAAASSRTAYDLFVELVARATKLTPGRLQWTDYADGSYLPVLAPNDDIDHPETLLGKEVEEWFSLCYGRTAMAVENGSSPMISKMQERILNPERLKKLIGHKRPVQKSDILFLCFYNAAMDPENDFASMDLGTRKEFIESFRLDTNDILRKAFLPDIYYPNFFDNAVFASLCSPSPIEAFENIFADYVVDDPFDSFEDT